MYKIKVQITGIAPIMINAYVPPTKSGKLSDEEYQKEALKKLHRDEQGNCCVTSDMIRACVVYGSGMASIKEGKKSIGQFLKAAMFPELTKISIGKKDPDFIDVRMGRIPPGPRGSMVAVYRPGFNTGWKLEFTMMISLDTLSAAKIKDCFVAAGQLAGIGANRPSFGRFKVTEWEVIYG